MDLFETISEMQARSRAWKAEGKTIALVPTMGFLHAGHSSLIEAAKKRADVVVVSIFVNPTQFAPNEDYENYPRDLSHDRAICEQAGVDCIFSPETGKMYPQGYSTFVAEERLSKTLCGISRPYHFRGVTTVVTKLFNIVQPEFAVFGRKDAQQVAIIRKMVTDLHVPVEIVTAPTVREEDGLAMSSRNRYLSPTQRAEATIIIQALKTAEKMVASGVRNIDRVVAEVTHLLGTKRKIRVIYVAIADRDTMEPMREIEPGKSMLAIAAWVDEVRLIDNVVL